VSRRKQPPILTVGPVSGKVYIVTRYRVLDAEKGQYEAQEKFDVTDQFEAIALARGYEGKVEMAAVDRERADVLVRVSPEILELLKDGESSPVVILRIRELDDGTHEMILANPPERPHRGGPDG
jgi:hypothetical protein